MRNATSVNSYTCAAASTAGYATNATGATWTLTGASAADLMGHPVTILNNSITDHSAKTVILTGTDANDQPLVETMNLPGTSATVTSTRKFKTLATAVPSATIGADTMNIGWSAVAHSPWVMLDPQQRTFNASVCVSVSGTINYDVEHKYSLAQISAVKHASITGKTAIADGTYVAPVHSVRVNVNSHTSGAFTFYVLQSDAA